MTTLARGFVAIARTKRRRFLWCAWWTGEPTEKPFRPPDAWGGGARTEEEARAMAERAAKMPLELVDGRWAGAFKRVRAGKRPFPSPGVPRSTEDASERSSPVDPHALLGVPTTATIEEIKVAFREKALVHHPDQGGDAEVFMAMKRAYDTLVRRRQKPRRR